MGTATREIPDERESPPVVPATADDAEAFGERIVQILNDGALTLLLSIGHRTGLFDAMADSEPRTSVELAEVAGLDERYVREWLGGVVVGGIVAHDPSTGTYSLPAAHAGQLSRRSPIENLAVYAQYVPLLGGIEDDIVTCFREGGGVPYERFGRFHEVMEEDSGQAVLPALEDHILPLVPGLTERLDAGIRVLDVGCGRGRALIQLAGAHPASTFVGYDLSAEAIAYARARAESEGRDNVEFHELDATRLAEVEAPGSFDLAFTFDAVHDQSDPAGVLAAIHDVLADDGVYLAVDIDSSSTHHGDVDHPLGTLLYTVSLNHCMTVSLARDGTGLGAMWGRERAREHFAAAGFTEVGIHNLEHDPQNAYYVLRP